MSNKEDFKKCPAHYAQGIETIEKIRLILGHLEGRVSNFEALAIGNFIKYIDRLGLKDSVEKDSFKAADYIHLTIKGMWLNTPNEWKTVEDFDSPYAKKKE
jgi:hypothetical protein